MCTLSLWQTEEHLVLTMNRDDLIARAESGPRIWGARPSRFAAPLDLQANGTWIGVNISGIAACLLNRYDDAPAGVLSRGAIVPAALEGDSVAAALSKLQALDLGKFSPFSCVVASVAARARFDWDGANAAVAVLELENPWITTSSSWALAYVTGLRQRHFEKIWRMPAGAETKLSAFHTQPVANGDAWAPMMQREFAETKSITQIRLSRSRAVMRYWPRQFAIARGLAAPALTLAIRLDDPIAGAAHTQAAD